MTRQDVPVPLDTKTRHASVTDAIPACRTAQAVSAEDRAKLRHAAALAIIAMTRQDDPFATEANTRQAIATVVLVAERMLQAVPRVACPMTCHALAAIVEASNVQDDAADPLTMTRQVAETANTARSRQDVAACCRASTLHAAPVADVWLSAVGPHADGEPTQAVDDPPQELGILY